MSELLRRAFRNRNRQRFMVTKQGPKRPRLSLPPSKPVAESSTSNTNTAVESSVPATTAIPQRAESGDLQQLRMQHQLKGMTKEKAWKKWEVHKKWADALNPKYSSKDARSRNGRIEKMLRLMGNPLEEWRTMTSYRSWRGIKNRTAYRLSRPRLTPRLQYGRLGARLSKQAAKEKLDEKFEALVTQAYWVNLVAEGDEWKLPAQQDEIIKQAAFRQEVAEEEAKREQEAVYQEVVRGFVPINRQ